MDEATEGYIASLRQMAAWVTEAQDGSAPASECIGIEDVDADELTAAADHFERRIAELEKALGEMIFVYWGEGDGQLPEPVCIERAWKALNNSPERVS